MFTSGEQFPQASARIFLVGIGGIGMSGLAQFLVKCGYTVAGSDRALNQSAMRQLFDALRAQGIELYPQDGSGVKTFHPDALVLSSAIENDNPDLTAFSGPLFHRAAILATLCQRQQCAFIGVAGSCGKTSVAAWIASVLANLHFPITMINGGYVNDFAAELRPGNFFTADHPQFIIAEIDESDRSIDYYAPDYGIVLNIGDDHYGRQELADEFNKFLARCKCAAIAPASLKTLLNAKTYFDDTVHGYRTDASGIYFTCDEQQFHSSQCGQHSAINGAAVYAVLRQALVATQLSSQAIADAMEKFKGVRQRFDIVVNDPKTGHIVINDYAHNPEKIAAAVNAAQERFARPLTILFQPHGFKPLEFMRAPLKQELQRVLKKEDTFAFLPVYYVGGTTSFAPSSEEVAQEYATAGMNVKYMPSREAAAEYIASKQDTVCLVLGARDPSLYQWSCTL